MVAFTPIEMTATIDELGANQLASGAFASTMHDDLGAHSDENGFVTAQVLRALGRQSLDPGLGGIVARALDFLETCERTTRPGAFCFWPEGKRPAWVPAYPEDADDTATTSMELARHGRRDRAALRRTVCQILIHHRVAHDGHPPAMWVRPGAFWTWLQHDRSYNVVDCVVNANVVALMATAGLTEAPGYAEACDMIENAVRLANGNPALTRLLAPYYTHPGDLYDAVRYAVAAGVAKLVPTLRLLERWGSSNSGEDRPVFSSAYGRVTWTSPLLQRLRALERG
jgi:hypothetical protein